MTIYRAMEQVFAALGITEDDVIDSTEADWDKPIRDNFAVWTNRWVCVAEVYGPLDDPLSEFYFQCVRRDPTIGEHQIPPKIRVRVDSR